MLLRGGFPFTRDELSVEEWEDLGTYRLLLDEERELKRLQMLIGRG